MPRYRDEDRYRDDYDRRRPRQAAPEREDNTAVKIIAVIAAAVVAVMLVFGGLAFYVFYSIGQGAKQVEEDVVKTVERQQAQFAIEQERNRQWIEEQRKKHEAQLEREEKERKEQDVIQRRLREEKVAVMGKATQLANAFVREAKAGRASDAYAMTSAAYRRRVSEQQFADLVRENANSLRGMAAFREKFVVFDRDLEPPFTYADTRAAQGGFLKLEVTVAKEGDDWKVDSFFIGFYDPFNR